VIIIVLILTSIHDYKRRTISNYYWIFLMIFGIIKIILTNILPSEIFKYNTGQLFLLFQMPSILFGLVINFILYKSGLFSGADFKAVFSISLFIPTINDIYIKQNLDYLARIFWYPILSFYLNLGLLLIFYSLIIFIINLFKCHFNFSIFFEGHENLSFLKKLVILFSSFCISFDNTNFRYYYVREKIVNGELKIQLGFSRTNRKKKLKENQNNFEYLLSYNRKIKIGLENFFEKNQLKRRCYWINPILPLIIFFTIDLIILIVFGDIILSLNYVFSISR